MNPPHHYQWLVSIFRSITPLQRPYALFNELSENENDVLQLCDYLGIDAFPSPRLKGVKLVLANPSNETDQKRCVRYNRARLSEARDTAAQFIISLSKNEYDLEDSDTVQSIFDLILALFSNESVFSCRFRYHTLTIVKDIST